MEETIFPPSPSWFLPNIIAAKEGGTVSYGSKNNIVILRSGQNKNSEMSIIQNAHTLKVTAVAFSPFNCCESVQNTLVSCSEDGFVKLWKINTLTAIMGQRAHWEQNGDVGKIVSLDWSSADSCHIVSAAENNSLVLWNVLTNSTKKFSFQKNLGTTVISCCPYSEKIVAVGGKSGQIHIINLLGSGEILYKLRGHDNKIHSLSWCPIPYNVFKADEIYEEFLLASACQNKEIFIWRVGTDGKCEAKVQIPSSSLNKKDNQCHGKIGNSFNYSALLWFEPYKIYTSSNFGELIYFDIKSYLSNLCMNGSTGQKLNKQSLVFFKLGHYFHTKGLFAIAGSPVKPEVVIYKNIKIKSQHKYVNGSNYEIIKKDGNENRTDMTWEAVMPKTSSLLWTAGQDRRLISCELKSSNLEIISTYHTVNGFVYCAAVSPHDPNKIAIGAGDGLIRLWNLTNYTDIQIHWQKIKDRVMSLAWHPTKDGLLAYGTSEGRVGLIDTNSSNKLPSVFKPSHHHPIYSLSWGPPFTSESSYNLSTKSEFDLYAVGDNTLALYSPSKLNADPQNLSKIIPFPCKKQTDICWKPDYSLMAVGNEDGNICLVKPSTFEIVYTVLAYKKMIESIAWHPSSTSIDTGLSPFHGYFTSGSTDNDCEIRVFNCFEEGEKEVKVEQVATLKGHFGHIVSVCWSPHISGRLISSSADFSVQIWDVVSQTPLVNFTPSGMPLFSLCSPIDSDLILTGCKNDVLHIWRASAQTRISPAPNTKTKKVKNEKSFRMSLSKNISTESAKIIKNKEENETVNIAVAEKMEATKNSKESKIFSKIWKGEASDELKTCYFLLKNEKREENEGNYSFMLLDNEKDLVKLFLAEEESLKRSNNRTELGELALWIGNLKEVLEEKIHSGQLNDFLVSLAPCIGPRLWQEACIAYSKTLAEKKMYRKAASYLIACHKIYEAIQLLVDANFHVEALCIAQSRLPEKDPMLKSIIEGYAQWLFKNGSLLKACECYIYLEDYLEVAKICGKKNHAEYLSLAALAAKKCGSHLELIEATNALFKCFETDNFELAQRICNDHSNLTFLGLLFYVYHTMHQLETGELQLKKDLLSHVKESFNAENVTFPSSLPKHYHNYSSYKSKRQMFTIVTEELCFAVCSQKLEEVITHLIKALSTSCRFVQSSNNEVQPLYKLCAWLSPLGFLNGSDFFSLKNDQISLKIKSMRAFLCAAIVRHWNNNQNTDDILKYLDLINQLKEDLLDKENFKYFKNLIDIEICEKRILKNRSKLSRKTIKNEKNCCKQENNLSDAQNSASTNSEKIKKETTENGFSERDIQKTIPSEIMKNLENNKNSAMSLQNNLTNENEDEAVESIQLVSTECENVESETESYLEKNIQTDLEFLSSLKEEIENFEKTRVSSPNPVPIYFILKKLFERIPESETAKTLQENLEKKWNELNSTK